MSKKITISDAAVKRLPDPTNGRREFFWDDRLTGFGVQITPNGTRTYVYQYRRADGATRRYTIGQIDKVSASAARKRADAARAAVRNGEDPAADKRSSREKVTLEDVIDSFIEALPTIRTRRTKKPLRESTRREYKLALKKGKGSYLPPDLLRREARSLTAADVRVAMPKVALRASGNARSTSDGETTANHVWRALSRALSWAAENGMIGVNPLLGSGGVPFEDRKKERYLTTEELGRLSAALSKIEGSHPKAAAIVRLLLLTGCRRSEIEKLRWKEVHLDAPRPFLDLEETKTGSRRVELNEPAAEVLKAARAWRIVGNDHVFPSEAGEGTAADKGDKTGATAYQNLGKVWRNSIRKEAGLQDLRIHDLRHSFASFAVWQGVALPAVGRLLGHRSSQTTARYAHIADEIAAAGADSVGAFITGVPAKPKEESKVENLDEARERLGSGQAA